MQNVLQLGGGCVTGWWRLTIITCCSCTLPLHSRDNGRESLVYGHYNVTDNCLKRSSLCLSLMWSPLWWTLSCPDLTFPVQKHLFPGTDNITTSWDQFWCVRVCVHVRHLWFLMRLDYSTSSTVFLLHFTLATTFCNSTHLVGREASLQEAKLICN